jgi:hypothetical protein
MSNPLPGPHDEAGQQVRSRKNGNQFPLRVIRKTIAHNPDRTRILLLSCGHEVKAAPVERMGRTKKRMACYRCHMLGIYRVHDQAAEVTRMKLIVV